MRANVLAGIVFVAVITRLALPAGAVEFPGPKPGEAKARLDGDRIVLENAVLSAVWRTGDGAPRLVELADRISGTTLTNPGEAPSLVISPEAGGAPLALRSVGKPALERIAADPKAVPAAEHFPGVRVTLPLESVEPKFRLQWRLTLRDGSNYLRQEMVIQPGQERVSPKSVTSISLAAPGAKAAGEVDGSPVVAGNFFFACEHPMAQNDAAKDAGRVVCSVSTFRTLEPGEAWSAGAVIGVAPPGQLRRAFLCYLERERPRPYQPFLHYNSWYDIAWNDRKMDEAKCLAVIDAFGRELIEKRQGKLDSLVFDDGWDDNQTLWRFHPGFPRGFTPLAEAAARRGTSIGVWLSPWGGYAQAKKERLKYGETQGFETNRNGFSLAGPKYYARFREVCAEMVTKYQVNYFKFDGIAQGVSSKGAGREFAADVDSMLRLIRDLRALRPDLFVSVTSGTWPSPFWLLTGDSVWRNGEDMNFFGPGSKRQQWLTYRDMHTYRGIVRRAPLYPINSLMIQGIVHAQLGPASRMSDDLRDMADEVRSFFGTGTQNQELYITPRMFTPGMWDLLAEGSAWSRRNADVLADVHWVGGDPSKAEVYGFAAWSPRLGVLTLRNPSDQPGTITIDVEKAFELPAGAPRRYRLASPWKDRPRAEQTLEAGRAETFRLAPFETLMVEATAAP